MLELENKVYEMRFESEIDSIIYDCEMYLMESEEVKPQTNAQKEKKKGLIQRIFDAIKKLIQRIKSLFTSTPEKDVKEYKEVAPAQGISEVDAAAKRLSQFAKKENPTEEDIRQAEKDNQILKDAKEKEKETKKKNAKIVARGVLIGGAVLYDLYWNLRGCEKKIEKMNNEQDKMWKRIDSGENVSDEEIDKLNRKLQQQKILSNTLGFITMFIKGFSAGEVLGGIAYKVGKTDKLAGAATAVGGGYLAYKGLKKTLAREIVDTNDDRPKNMKARRDSVQDAIANETIDEHIERMNKEYENLEKQINKHTNESTFDDLYYQINSI